ncbi:efflux RND transporter periplasmic adaptor subunit, partial [Geminicoccus flavidas]|uniref:efflux RND transporter periplasmic adaptor subunit n=1 Tax=Geminicoccus flavidas TaxID=2506407 RepID=UPI001357F353
PVTTSHGFIGRVEAVDRVDLVARVDAFLVEQLFEEGAEVQKGDPLYRLERGPYEAVLAAQEAAVAQAEAEQANARAELSRARELLSSTAGTQARVDQALAAERTATAKVLAAQAQVRQAQINLGYTEINAPITGRIGRSQITPGNVVGPGSGVLATIVSQEPMHVAFPVPMRTALELRTRYADQGGFEAVVIRLRLPDGRTFGPAGRLDFVDIEVARGTDTITLRGTIPNPILAPGEGGGAGLRELTEGEFVTVMLEAAQPVEQLTVPREAVLSDQRGDFVYVIAAENRAERRPVRLGQSTAGSVVILEGLQAGEQVVLEGIQRVQPGMQVVPGPAGFDARTMGGTTASGT